MKPVSQKVATFVTFHIGFDPSKLLWAELLSTEPVPDTNSQEKNI